MKITFSGTSLCLSFSLPTLHVLSSHFPMPLVRVNNVFGTDLALNFSTRHEAAAWPMLSDSHCLGVTAIILRSADHRWTSVCAHIHGQSICNHFLMLKNTCKALCGIVCAHISEQTCCWQKRAEGGKRALCFVYKTVEKKITFALK